MQVKHPLLEFGVDRGIKIAVILTLLKKYGFLTRKQLREMSEVIYHVRMTGTQVYNLLKLLSLYGYVKGQHARGRVRGEKGYVITNKGETLLRKMREESKRLGEILR